MMEYYSAFKRKQSLTQATAWLDLEDIMQSGTCQPQKGQIVFEVYEYEVPREDRFVETMWNGGF
jgi:hypothetical protein